MDGRVNADLAVPLDEWCEICSMKLAAGVSYDGLKACLSCMTKALDYLGFSQPNRAERRRRSKSQRRRGRGYTR